MRKSIQSAATPLRANDSEAADNQHCASAWQQFLDDSLDHNVRTIHVEQDADCCRIRKRAGGILSEQRMDSGSFADELLHYLQQTLPRGTRSEYALTTQLVHRHVECNIECHWYRALRGEVLVIRIHHERNIPESLEQTTLDTDALLTLRQAIHNDRGGLTIISCRSNDLLCDLYYSLLGELTPLDHKVISFESAPRKALPRINQIISSNNYSVPNDASQVFIDWVEARNPELIQGILSNYQSATVFTQAHSLSEAIRQLTDLSNNERQLATNVTALIEVDRVRLICPHCASAQQPGKFEIRLMMESGLGENSTLNYAAGCDCCDYTGFGQAKTLVAHYRCNDLLRDNIESRDQEAIDANLSASTVTSIKAQKGVLISKGVIELSLAPNSN